MRTDGKAAGFWQHSEVGEHLGVSEEQCALRDQPLRSHGEARHITLQGRALARHSCVQQAHQEVCVALQTRQWMA